MNKKTPVIILFLLLLLAISASAEVPEKIHLSNSWKYTYNSTTEHKNEILIQGKHILSDHISIGAGFSTAFNSLPEVFYANIDINNFPSFLRYRLSLLSRDFPDYEIRENSIYPTVTLLTKYIEAEVGISFRILQTDVQTATAHTLYRLQFNIVNRSRYRMSLKLSNVNTFRAGNITELYYTLQNRISFNKNLQITADIGYSNAGQIAFAGYYSSFFGQLGVNYQL